MLVQQDISLQKNRQKTGQTIKTIIDKEENEHYTGRTEFDSPEVDNTVIVLKHKEPLRIGDFYNVKISSAEDYDLTGTVCPEL
ncbi:MAG: TRAM domain-containing protein [Bacteroidales bacterium]|jgi:ribosomal protein S12 methylthiotransferase|nr:TRAM domain-containing protein [Bacteroidales bacterium]